MYDLTIVIPGTRVEGWQEVCDSIDASIGKYSYEVIFIGPTEPNAYLKEKKDVTFIHSLGSPTYTAHIASLEAKGRVFTWAADDGTFLPGALEKAMNLFFDVAARNDNKNVMVMRYMESHPGQKKRDNPDDPVWRGWDLNVWTVNGQINLQYPDIPLNWVIPVIGMISLNRFRELGGFDCRFQHINASCIDLGFRCQYDGGQGDLSPTLVQNLDKEVYNPNSPVENANREDFPLLNSLYMPPNSVKTRTVDYNNWKDTPAVWDKAFRV